MTKIEHAHKHRSDFRFDHDGMWPHHHDYETDQPIWWEGPIPAPAEATAAAEQRLAGLREAAQEWADADDALDVLTERLNENHAETGEQASDEALDREAAAEDRLNRAELALRALLDTTSPASPRQGEPVEGHDPEAKCRTCGHREHDHHHSADPRWCGADFAMLGFTACPCPGYAALSEPAEAGEP